MAEKTADMNEEELFRGMLESVQMGMFVVDTGGCILCLNKFARAALPPPPGEIWFAID